MTQNVGKATFASFNFSSRIVEFSMLGSNKNLSGKYNNPLLVLNRTGQKYLYAIGESLIPDFTLCTTWLSLWSARFKKSGSLCPRF